MEIKWDNFNFDEIEVIVLAMLNHQTALSKCKWTVIDSLLKRQILVEVAKPLRSKNGETIIKLKDNVSFAKLSTNRI